MIKNPLIHIIVPVFNRFKITSEFIERIRRQTYQNYILYIVDDKSPDNTGILLENIYNDWKKLIILYTTGNAWWAGGIYVGIQHVLKKCNSDDSVLLMNDDVLFDDNLIEKLVDSHAKKPNAILSAIPVRDGKTLKSGSNMIFWGLAISTSPFVNYTWPNRKIPEYFRIQFQFAHATLYPINIIRVIGHIAYKELPHYHSDGEYSWRAIKMGYESFVVSTIPVYSFRGNTGLFNCYDSKYTLVDLINSFFNLKSTNHIRSRWNFAKLAAPFIWRYSYFLTRLSWDFFKSIWMILRIKYFKTKVTIL